LIIAVDAVVEINAPKPRSHGLVAHQFTVFFHTNTLDPIFPSNTEDGG
jgi:hypothetical protein